VPVLAETIELVPLESVASSNCLFPISVMLCSVELTTGFCPVNILPAWSAWLTPRSCDLDLPRASAADAGVLDVALPRSSDCRDVWTRSSVTSCTGGPVEDRFADSGGFCGPLRMEWTGVVNVISGFLQPEASIEIGHMPGSLVLFCQFSNSFVIRATAS